MSDSLLPPAGGPLVEAAAAERRYALVVVPESPEQAWHAVLLPDRAATPLEFAAPLDLLRYLTQPATAAPPPLVASRHGAAPGRGLR